MPKRAIYAQPERDGWEITEVFEDTISGAKTKRPALERLLKGVIRKEFDVVMVLGCKPPRTLSDASSEPSGGLPCEGYKPLLPYTGHRHGH